jgi:hypothetical protein
VRLEGLKIPMTSSGIEAVTFRLVAGYLNSVLFKFINIPVFILCDD